MDLDDSQYDLSFLAAREKSALRSYKEEEHSFRSKFERDRDRILYSRAFRRLSGKTQIFLSSYDDHIRTRLTHTLEVSQIAKTIAKRLRLNEPLVEAMALGHDLGHTPFGHVAERTLTI
jgi:dGTPase